MIFSSLIGFSCFYVALRKELLLYKWGKDDYLLKKIKYLIDNGIELHGQIVLIPNKNDGDQLFKTASDIYNFHPQFKTHNDVGA